MQIQIRTKILLLFFTCMVLVVGALISFTRQQVQNHYTDLFHQRGEIAAQELVRRAEHLIELGLRTDEFLGFNQQCSEIVAATPGVTYAALVDKGGNILYHSADPKGITQLPEAPNQTLVIKRPLKFASLNLGSHVVVAIDRLAVYAQVDQLLNKIMIVGIVLTLLGSGSMFVFMQLDFLNPVNSLLRHIKTMEPDSKRDLPPELAAREDEIGTIATAFDQLANRVADSQYKLLNHTHLLEKTVQERTQELRLANEELQRLAHTDTLTGLPNRLSFMNLLKQSVTQAIRYDHTLAVFLLDLDGFKTINDHYGHAAGDHALKTLAERVSTNVRDGDSYSRLGGDEFALLVAEFDADTNLQQIAEKILTMICEPLLWENTELSVNASIGIAILDPTSKRTAEELLIDADAAMYDAKRRGLGYRFSIRPISLDQSG